MSLEKQRTLAETNPPLLFVLCLCVCDCSRGKHPLQLQWDNGQYSGWETCGGVLAGMYRSTRWIGPCGLSSAWEQLSTAGLPNVPAPSSLVSFAPALAVCPGNDWWSLVWTSAARPANTRKHIILLDKTFKSDPTQPAPPPNSALELVGCSPLLCLSETK